MEWLIAILAVIAAATSAYGVKTAANAQQQASNYNAEVSKKNAEAANQQALYDADQIRTKNKRLLSAQKAAYAASGVDNTGSALDVEHDSAIEGELDALTAIYTGRTSANASNARAKLDTMSAQAAGRTGNIGVASSLLGSANSYGAGYMNRNPNFGASSPKTHPRQ